MWKILCAVPIVALAGCQSLTPTQQAQLFCVVAADGTAIAVAATKGGAQATAQSVANASVVACQAATQVGQIVTPVPAAK